MDSSATSTVRSDIRVLLVSGGSGGHLAPLLAVGEALKKQAPDVELLYCCADQEADRAFLAAHGERCVSLAWPRRAWRSPLLWLRNWRQSQAVLSDFQPDVVFSKGGSVSLLTCLLAKKRGIPVVLHESDAVWGRANKTAMKAATKICLGFQPVSSLASAFSLLPSRPVVTGNPVRSDITHGKRDEGLRITGLSGEKPILLVMGGSQGAQALNEIVVSCLEELLKKCDVIHLTGKGKSAAMARRGYYATEFATDALPHLYAATTIALSRAGAGSIAELAANGIPTILVPLRGVAQDHQFANALAARDASGCIVLEQETLKDTLIPAIQSLIDTRSDAGNRMRALHHPDAATDIARIVLESKK